MSFARPPARKKPSSPEYRWIAYLGLLVILYVALGMVFRGVEELRPVLSAVAGLG
jgi:hypothetical protein